MITKCHAGAGHGPAIVAGPWGRICAECFARLVKIVEKVVR